VQQVVPLAEEAGGGLQGLVKFAEVQLLLHPPSAALFAAGAGQVGPVGDLVMTQRGVIKNADPSMPLEVALNVQAALVAQRTGQMIVPALLRMEPSPERPLMVIKAHGMDLRKVLQGPVSVCWEGVGAGRVQAPTI
jgi:hypothetical protein